MKFSIQIALSLIVSLLFLASLVSIYFAISSEQITPLGLVALVNIVAVILLTFLITRGIMQPLGYIREIMKKVGEGDLTRRINFKSTKEMEELGETFNSMIFRLHNARQGVEGANKILEHRVQERTSDIRNLASSLEEKVQARTKELKEKVKQLERFQKLAVGRELRMVELKEIIQRMQAKEQERSSTKNIKKEKTL